METFHVVYWDPKQDTERERVIEADDAQACRALVLREHSDAHPELTCLDDEARS